MASILATVRDLDRLRQIVLVLGKHGFGEVVKRTGMGSLLSSSSSKDSKVSAAERLRLVLTELGPSAVKLGQILSTRPDLLPEDVIVELTKLQDAVPPLPFEQLRGQLEEALGAPIA